MPSISQATVGGNCCGACAASYVLEDLLGKVFSVSDIMKLWAKIAFDPGSGNVNLKSGNVLAPLSSTKNIHKEDTDPTKLTKELEASYPVKAKAYMHPKSALKGVVPLLSDAKKIVKKDGIGLLAGMEKWRGIGIYTNNGGLHYMATKWEGGHYKVKDSNRLPPVYTNALKTMDINDTWSDSTMTIAENYKYWGAIILVYKG